MPFWVAFKGFSSDFGPLNVSVRNLAFFRQGMGENCHILAVKEIEDAVVHTTTSGAKLVNAIAEVISLGASQFMANFSESPDTHHTLCIDLSVLTAKRAKPLDHRSRAILILVEKDLGEGQSSYLYLYQYCYNQSRLFLSVASSGKALKEQSHVRKR